MAIYVKVDESNNATPYSIARLRKDNPNVSFPEKISETTLNAYGVYTVKTTPKPTYNSFSETLKESFTQDEQGVWIQTWAVTQKSTADAQSALFTEITKNRYNKEQQGVMWTDASGDIWYIDTSTASQNRIANVLVAIQQGKRTDGGVWKCAKIDGETQTITFRSTTNAELIEIGELVHNHVQKCFDAEANASNKVLAGDYTASFENEFSLL